MSQPVKAPAKERRTIMQLASVPNVRDPAAHAKHQVSELDKTAKASQLKRKQCLQAIDDDKKELEHVEDQIARLMQRYVPLCSQLEDKTAHRKGLMELLSQCMEEEKKVTGSL
jgi:vacuolar-type H+-ATPase subunit I/STV1